MPRMQNGKQDILSRTKATLEGITSTTIHMMERSTCAVQVGAVLTVKGKITATGWNSMGPTGMGQHAEAHCISRSYRKNLYRSTLWIAAQRKRNAKTVTAKPCEVCQGLLKDVGAVMYRDAKGDWVRLQPLHLANALLSSLEHSQQQLGF